MNELTTKRRSFLTWVTAGAAAFIGLMVGIPMAGYTILPALKRREEKWAEAGPVDVLPPKEPKELDVLVTVSDGWQQTTAKRSVWALKTEEGQVRVYSPICPHLGCGYRWESSQRRFHCPCHNSNFSIDGDVLGGPAPRPLDPLPVKVENGKIFVMYKEFKAGTKERIEL